MNDPIDPVTYAVWRATKRGPAWHPAWLTCEYTLAGPVRAVVRLPFPVFGHAPWWHLNVAVGFGIAQWVAVSAWWSRLVIYGTPSEHFVACLLASWACQKWLELVT